MKTLFPIFLLILIGTAGFGQNIQQLSVADSLKAELAKATHDTARALIYAKLVEVGTDIKLSSDEKLVLGQKEYELSRKFVSKKALFCVTMP